MMRKLLMISYFYPPVNKIGAQRSLGFSKYLPEFGWQPIVLSRNWAGHREPVPDGVKVISTPYRDKHSLFRKGPIVCTRNERDVMDEGLPIGEERSGWLKNLKDRVYFYAHEVLDYPEESSGWIPFALAAGRKIIREEKISAVFSTSSPITSHIIAHQLKQEFRLHWIADFRDPWTQNPYVVHTWIRNLVDQRLERKIIKTSDLIVVISDPFAELMKTIHHRGAEVIPNGFDPPSYPPYPVSQNDRFILTYVGHLYGGRRDPSPLFSAVRELMDEKTVGPSDMEIRFYGAEKDIIRRQAAASRIPDVVQCYDEIPFRESLLKQKESTALLLLRWDAGGESIAIPGKLFEYLGAGRPILSIPRIDGPSDDLIRKTRAGVIAGNKKEVKDQLKKWFLEFKEKGFLPYDGQEEIIRQYTREKQTEQLASWLDKVCPSNKKA
jgi:glycosyltransferase involved in cell wall biosynthesis